MTTSSETFHSRDVHTSKKSKTRSTIFGWIRFLLFLAAIFFIFRYALGITLVDGKSMNPTLHDNDIVLTNNIFYQHERDDIVIINENGFPIIKRIIALPHETVEIKNGTVFVNGDPLEENYTIGISNNMPEVLVEEGTYFVIGDNRTPGESLDSRSSNVGLIPAQHILGEAFFSIKSFQFL